MKNLLKGSKRLLAAIVAISLLVASTFTTSFGVSADTSDSGTNIKYWDGSIAAGFSSTATGDEKDPIIINTVAELAYLVRGADGNTAGKFYKISDNIDIIIAQTQNMAEAIMALDGWEEVKSYFAGVGAIDWYRSGTYTNFEGTFDGNGVVIYGLGGTQNFDAKGLFPVVGINATIKNVAVRNSYIYGGNGVGGIVGRCNTSGTGSITISNCEVANCYIETTRTAADYSVGTIIGWVQNSGEQALNIDNCLVYGSYACKPTGYNSTDNSPEAGLFGRADDKDSNGNYLTKITNTVTIDSVPYNVFEYANCSVNDCFSNVYTNDTFPTSGAQKAWSVTYTNIKTVTDTTGSAAKAAMSGLDWDNVWLLNDGVPSLRVFHNLTYTSVDSSTHKITGCADEFCNLTFNNVSTQSSHVYTKSIICDCCGYEKESTLYYNKDITDETLNDFGETGADWDNAIIIDSAEELQYLVDKGAANTTGKYYKVADGIDTFVLQDNSKAEAIMALDGYSAVKTYFEANGGSEWYKNYSDNEFGGNFDGNGVAIYGLYTKNHDMAGLFPRVAITATIKNVAVRNSYIHGGNGVGGIAGRCNTSGTGSITISNCEVANCYIETTRTAADYTAGTIIGWVQNSGEQALNIDNCLVYGSYACKPTGYNSTDNDPEAGLFGRADDKDSNGNYLTKITNTVTIGSVPYNVFEYANCSVNDCFSNVYTNDTFPTSGAQKAWSVTYTNIKTVTDTTGSAAKAAMPNLDWDNVWFANDGVPALRVFHTIKAEPSTVAPLNGHIEVCDDADCELTGVVLASHTYNSSNICTECGYKLDDKDIADVWSGAAADSFESGSGTETDPYIIKTADQLYKMVKEGGKNSDGTAAYYKVADDVDALYLNDVQFGNLNTLKSQVADGSAKNWTADFSAEKYFNSDFTETFSGVFDGNGVTIYGLYSASNSTNYYNANGNETAVSMVGFLPAMCGNAVIKNVAFECSYIITADYNAAVVTTNIEKGSSYLSVLNVSVRNAHIETTNTYDGTRYGSCAGIVAAFGSPKKLVIMNCLFDGYSSELVQPSSVANDRRAGIISPFTDLNNYKLINCVSLGINGIPQVSLNNINNTSKITYTNCYTDVAGSVNNNFTVVDTVTATGYDYMGKMPMLDWSQWSLVDVELDVKGNAVRTIPMPVGVVASNGDYYQYVDMITDQTTGAGNFSFNGPYEKGTYGMYGELIGGGTETDPYIISNGFELARAIGTGGMNRENPVYYKLACDIDLSGIKWITTDNVYLDEAAGTYKYKYVDFGGVLDGDGYTVYGLYAADDGASALIPVLASGGQVKNLHIRDSYVYSSGNYAGALVGEAKSGSVITGCSVENTIAKASTDMTATFTGNWGAASVTYSYVVTADGVATYCDATANDPKTADEITADYTGSNSDAIWYCGGNDQYGPKLVNRANAMPCADVDGDGNGYEYTAADLSAMQSKLLRKSGYSNIYGDVSRNGKTNLADLAILRRHINDDYADALDGFWRNANLGKFTIYYGENDNYDSARKMELYLEQVLSGVDVQKRALYEKVTKTNLNLDDINGDMFRAWDLNNPASSGCNFAIIIGNIEGTGSYNNTAIGENDYKITYTETDSTAVLWLQGGSFTAVEQAVIDFAANSNPLTGYVHTINEATTIKDDYKLPVTLPDDTTTKYYYAWGDEFAADEGYKAIGADGKATGYTIDLNNWSFTPMSTESSTGEDADYSKLTGIDKLYNNWTGEDHYGYGYNVYHNLENVSADQLTDLYIVEDGKLSIKRGYVGAVDTAAANMGWVSVSADTQNGNGFDNAVIDSEDVYASAGCINTANSMLFKQGYSEIKAALPSDGHSFVSWWLLGAFEDMNNNAYNQSLYSKVYEENENWNKENTLNSSRPETYRYKLPNAYFEIDIIEIMQTIDKYWNTHNDELSMFEASHITDDTTNIWDYNVYTNIHKFYNTGMSANGGKFSPINWSTNSNFTDSSGNTVSTTAIKRSAEGAYQYDFADVAGTTSNSLEYVYNSTAQAALTAMRRYGFLWKVADTDSDGTPDDITYKLYIYDLNGDGDESDYTIIDVSSLNYTNTDELESYVTDAETANQYMFFLLDNHYYSYNNYYNREYIRDTNNDDDAIAAGSTEGGKLGIQYSNLLTANTNEADKCDMDIDYIRIYQEKGKKDIITSETEDFNTGSLFGY